MKTTKSSNSLKKFTAFPFKKLLSKASKSFPLLFPGDIGKIFFKTFLVRLMGKLHYYLLHQLLINDNLGTVKNSTDDKLLIFSNSN
ncbi:MAG: hypothetical protein MR750_05930 [Methanobrevibacter boviskoreani]|uniref:hypothetical protein n=1 Tax=Methanobrevibacter boviskoreani TaxID=1348249 RepID=UPI0023A79EF7|nr:hypothetical protein [Methanobrevibacter boviskoreani]MCI6930767.1 hypothetical protein [Methanobrevibacter boviskoreani]